jgi:hypothetical protein
MAQLLVRRLPVVVVMSVLLAFVSSLAPSHAETPTPHEYQVKAAFLYTFIKFVEWPNAGAARPLCVAVLGQDPFGEDLEGIKGKSAKGRSIVIKRYRKVEDVKDCDVLFISASEKGHLARLLKQLQNSPVLTVADHEGFCQAGGMINLITVKNKVGFEINTAAAQRAQLHISSQLLKLAKIVVE